MAKVQFNKTVKYNGENIPPNTIFEVSKEDLKSVLADGGHLIDNKPAAPTEAEKQAKKDLEVITAEAKELGLPVEENDTLLSLQTKVGVKKAEVADAKLKIEQLEAKKTEAVTAEVEIEDEDTIETLQAKIDAKLGTQTPPAGEAGQGQEQVQDVFVSPYKNWDKPKLIAELDKRQIPQEDLVNDGLREKALIDDDAKIAAAGQS